MPGTIDRAGELLARAVRALEGVGGDVRAAGQLLALLGWSLPPGVADLGLTQLDVSALVAKIEALSELRSNENASDADLAAAVAELVLDLDHALQHLQTLPAVFHATPEYLNATHIKDEFFTRLGDLLVIHLVGSAQPPLVPLGVLLGIFELTLKPADPSIFQVEHVRQVVRWDRLHPLVTDPAGLMRDVYGWGTPTFQASALLVNLGRLTEHFSDEVRLRHLPREAEERLAGHALPEADADPSAQLLASLAKGLGVGTHDVGLALYPLRASSTGASDAGLGLSPYAFGTTDTSFALSETVSLELAVSAEVTGGMALLLRPGAKPRLLAGVVNPDAAPAASPTASFALTLRDSAASGERHTLFSAFGLQVDAAALGAGVRVEAGEELNPTLMAVVDDARVRIVPDPSDGFLASVLPKDGITATLNLTVSYSHRDGLRIQGGAGLSTDIVLHSQIGPLRLERLQLALAATPDGLLGTAALTTSLALGPTTATIDAVGASVALRFARGNLGLVDLASHFKPPSGVGLTVDAGPVTGGGFLGFDPDHEQYAGEMHLQFEGIAVRAVGLLTTRLPDGKPGFSLLVLVSAEFPPVQLGLGFMLVGVGGLLGINRTVAVEALRTGLKTGALGAVLSPPDPKASAAQLVASLAGLFPPAVGRHVFAPTARIVWGSPVLITIDLCLVLELPSPVRLVALGRIRALLPEERDPVVRLQVDVLGVIDFDQQAAAVDATLIDSRIAQFALTGDLALRMSWGANPVFLLAVGGFHPRFAAPPGFPALDRVAVALASGDNPKLRLEAYLALTSNTVQFGARVDVGARAGIFSIGGFMAFDALVTLSPLAFEVDIAAKLAVKAGGHTLLSISLALTLSGPRPWHAHGRASFSILFFDVSFGFDVTIGDPAPAALPNPVDVAPLLLAALADPRAWTAQLPAGADVVTLRTLESGQAILAHPLATLQVRQRVAPLDRTLDRFGTSVPSGAKRFRITLATVGGVRTTLTPLQDRFAPAQFTAMSDDQKLSVPSFEAMTAGAALGAGGYATGAPVTVSVTYEQALVTAEGITPPGHQRLPLPLDVFATLTATTSVPAPAFAVRDTA